MQLVHTRENRYTILRDVSKTSFPSFWPQEVGACMIGVGGGWWLRFYTAIKEDMDFLVTENIDDFEKPLKLFKMERGTKLQLRNITDFEKMLKSTTTVKQVKHYKG
jgi:hypothetical protein